MEALKKLQQSTSTGKPYRGFTKLPVGNHQILRFRTVKNKFGKKVGSTSKSILIELEDQVLFLPQYFWQKINEKDMDDLNALIESGEEIHLYFGGKQEEGG